MPRIRIREIDNTGATQADSLISTGVFLPLPDKKFGDKKVDKPVQLVFSTGGDKVVVAGDESKVIVVDTSHTKGDDTFIVNALKYGAKLYTASVAYESAPGSSKDSPKITYAGDYLKDRNQFDIKFFLATEENLYGALKIVLKRKDAAVVLSLSENSYDENISKDLILPLDHELIGDSRDRFFDEESVPFAGKYVIPMYGEGLTGLTAAESYVLAYLYSMYRGNASWLAVAGSKRGFIPSKFADSVGLISEDGLDTMQPVDPETPAIAINPICKMNPWGVRIWGNRTALPVPKKGLIASSFANMRVLICDIKKAMYRAAREYQFEQNNDILWVNFKSRINTLLDQMVQGYGIAGYRWTKEDSGSQYKLCARLQIVPIEAVEDFDLTISLSNDLETSVDEVPEERAEAE